jgi:type III secretory pathway component EscU
MAVFDAHREKECRQMGNYYMWDYVGKECIKSVFSGTLAFVLLAAFVAFGSLSQLTAFLNSADLIQLGGSVLLLYVVFMAVYLLVTVLVYCVRYVYRRKELRGYVNHLRKVRKMYRQNEGKGKA